MNVIVLPRLAAECHTQATPWAHIAIADPGRAPLPESRCPRLRDRLDLHFMDVTPEDFQRNPAFERFRPFLFDTHQVGQIIAFLDRHPTAELDWVVNCEAGVSRSAAVANFVLEYFSSAQKRFAPLRYQPNPYVFARLIDSYFL